MNNSKKIAQSAVENHFIGRKAKHYESERIRVITVPNYVVLGQLTALRFIEWIKSNPQGIVALPTGKTPEYFIKWFVYYINHWSYECQKGIIGRLGLSSPKPPSCAELHLVQIDEFFPLNPSHERAFSNYIRQYYIKEFGFSVDRTLLLDTFTVPSPLKETITAANLEELFSSSVDLHLRFNHATNELDRQRQAVISYYDALCQDYERRIRAMGGIGFFLGGIGTDGHIGFNVRGTDHYSTTRLTELNYESMAAGAPDLGGIEIIRQKAVITIGLNTITFNPDATAIIFAAGEAKADIIANAVQNKPNLSSPASALQKLPGARFYLTEGAASQLTERRLYSTLKSRNPNRFLRLGIDSLLKSITEEDLEKVPKVYWKEGKKSVRLLDPAQKSHFRSTIMSKILKGLAVPRDQIILHTGPHHDDIELAYFPMIHHLVRSSSNSNTFCYLTSGFTSVTNAFLLERLTFLKEATISGRLFQEINLEQLCDHSTREYEIHGYLNAIADRNILLQNLFAAARMCRNLLECTTAKGLPDLQDKTTALITALQTSYPGAKDSLPVQQAKSWIREWEAETVWAHFGIDIRSVHHLRLPFYSAEIFPDDPQFQSDVLPIVNLLNQVKPTLVTLALDPEGSGPDTHYKCLMALRAALIEYTKDKNNQNLTIWGYRNVWSRFHPADADLIIPVSLNSFAVLDSMFNNCFRSQKAASFPSFELDGTFSMLAQKIWTEQFRDVTSIIGKDVFYKSEHPMMRRAYGCIYIKEMKMQDFISQTSGLLMLEEAKRRLKKSS